MEKQTIIDGALALAIEAHAGQTRWNGDPYVSHPMRVGAMVAGYGALAVGAALLHDVVEDTAITLEDLWELGFPAPLVVAVDALTRRPDETYDSYIRRIREVPLALSIKLADIADNMRDLDTGPRRDKYLKARRLLLH